MQNGLESQQLYASHKTWLNFQRNHCFFVSNLDYFQSHFIALIVLNKIENAFQTMTSQISSFMIPKFSEEVMKWHAEPA